MLADPRPLLPGRAAGAVFAAKMHLFESANVCCFSFLRGEDGNENPVNLIKAENMKETRSKKAFSRTTTDGNSRHESGNVGIALPLPSFFLGVGGLVQKNSRLEARKAACEVKPAPGLGSGRYCPSALNSTTRVTKPFLGRVSLIGSGNPSFWCCFDGSKTTPIDKRKETARRGNCLDLR